MLNIFHGDCIDAQKRIADKSVDLVICDPPFGLGESQFDKHYNRNFENVIKGYKEAPQDYASWTLAWLSEAKRVLKDDGSMYVVMGHSNLRALLNAAYDLNLYEINHLIWKYNFGVNTTKKYVTSHYHILYYSKNKNVKPAFNTYCRFGAQEKDNANRSLVYQDLEDVFVISKEFAPNQVKNQNKLPEQLISKLILYSSNKDDVVCDFFMGNFTTAYAAIKLGRNVCGYEINKNAYDYHMSELNKIEYGSSLASMRQFKNLVPRNKGSKISQADIRGICEYYHTSRASGVSSKQVKGELQEMYGRGKFAIDNILKKHYRVFFPEN